ncbi:MAG: glycosyltransferase [Coleofasciculus sp. S288]|nr:glycosyltransferase [Coleofasciculus sp. S288]
MVIPVNSNPGSFLPFSATHETLKRHSGETPLLYTRKEKDVAGADLISGSRNLGSSFTQQKKGMLLVLPVPFRTNGCQLLCEAQACNGLEQWADNFESIVVAAPFLPEPLTERNTTLHWRDTATLAHLERIEFVLLPSAYSPLKFLSCYASVRASLAELISRCHYLQFALGGLFGDWSTVAAFEAHKQGRRYAIHTDRVEHEVILQSVKGAKLTTQIKARIEAPLIAIYHKRIIKNCSLGLWHGYDCYSAYSPFSTNNHLIHDIHTKPSDCINTIELSEKIERVANDPTIHICYAGRMEPMKAPIDWIKAIGRARDLGVNLHATWLGHGSLLDEMKATIAKLNLNSCIELRGWEQNRDNLLRMIRESHLMLFTHITPESPRCLIEALICGTPIIGYQSKYAEDLVKNIGGGMFAPLKNWKELGNLLVTLSKERQRLSQLIAEAGQNGKRFNDEAVFRERSQLIKQYLF